MIPQILPFQVPNLSYKNIEKGLKLTGTIASSVLSTVSSVFFLKSAWDASQFSFESLTDSAFESLQNNMEKFKEEISESWNEANESIRSQMLTTSLVLGAAGTTILASQIAIQVIGAYARAYLRHYVGRPKLAMEYRVETFGTRLTAKLLTPYNFALHALYGPPEEKKVERPIFKQEIQDQVGTLEKAIKNTLKHEGYLGNLLLYGPPGTGKTMISKVLARETEMNYIMMSGGDLTQFIKRGEHVSELNNIFKRAKSADKPTIIFIDEAEGLAKDREKLDMPRVELLNSFLNHTGDPSQKVMLILATNRAQDLDSAVLSRMDHQIYIGPPEPPERLRILKMYLEKFFTPEDTFLEQSNLTQLNEKLEGFTGRDIFKLCNALSMAKTTTDNNCLSPELASKTLNQFLTNRARINRHIELTKV